MTTTYEGAINEIFLAFNQNLSSYVSSFLGYTPHIEWPGITADEAPDASKFWLRISTQNVGSDQKTLSENVVLNGSKRFETFGLVFVQIFAPKRNDSLELLNKLAMLIQNGFRNRTANVIIRNARIKEMPAENGCLRSNVIADFEFDEIF
jgi:hypothetical protein